MARDPTEIKCANCESLHQGKASNPYAKQAMSLVIQLVLVPKNVSWVRLASLENVATVSRRIILRKIVQTSRLPWVAVNVSFSESINHQSLEPL